MADSRKSWITVEYDGKNITEEISSTLLSFSYADKASDEADEIDLTLTDREGKWINEWYPKVRVKGSDE